MARLPASVTDRLDGFKVHEIKTMGKHSNDAEARALLVLVTRQVQPIMRKREWMCPLVSEFFPASAGLLGLNVNGGGGRTTEIKIRLRLPHDPTAFFPTHHILGTMLHELVHNVRGPHDAVFYKLLDELWAEVEELMDKGITGTGQGFDAPSVGRLGLHNASMPSHNPPAHKAREMMLAAAEARAKRQRLMIGGPQRLGGDCALQRGLTPLQAAAHAAERRTADNLWCPCERLSQQAGSAAEEVEEEQEAAQAGAARAQPPVPVAGTAASAGAASGSGRQPAGRERQPAPIGRLGSRQQPPHQQRLGQPGGGAAGSASLLPSSAAARAAPQQAVLEVDLTVDDGAAGQQAGSSSASVAVTALEAATAQGASDAWRCPACTLLNRPLALQCDACFSERPLAGAAGDAPSGASARMLLWACSACTLLNKATAMVCVACGIAAEPQRGAVKAVTE